MLSVPPGLPTADGVAVAVPMKGTGNDTPTVNGTVIELPPPGSGLVTPTCSVSVPKMLMLSAGIIAVSRLLETKVVGWLIPFQLTVAPGTKPWPSTSRVNAGPIATAVLGTSAAMVGIGLFTRNWTVPVFPAACAKIDLVPARTPTARPFESTVAIVGSAEPHRNRLAGDRLDGGPE